MANSFRPLFASLPAEEPHWLLSLASSQGFVADTRLGSEPDPVPPPLLASPSSESPGAPKEHHLDELEHAFNAGIRKGREEAQAEQETLDRQREQMRLSLEKLDEDMRAVLAQRLAQTVSILCDAAMAPLAVDRELLERNCSTAARLLGDAVDNATLRLNPEDIDFLGPAFAATWHLVSDNTLERGSIRFEAPEGEVLHGPTEWRASLAEALGLC